MTLSTFRRWVTISITTVAAIYLGPASAWAGVMLDDTWVDGERSTQKLPGESAWFVSSTSALSASTNRLIIAVGPNSIMALTYFTTNIDAPVRLGVGEALTASFRLSLGDVGPQTSSQGFRLGIFNFADSKLAPRRVNEDGFSSGALGVGVQGYALFQNMAVTFNNSKPMDIRKRFRMETISLLGTTSDWESLSRASLATNTFSGFQNRVPYTLTLALKRTATNALAISMTWSNTSSGATLASSAIDTNASNFGFDGIALRPGGGNISAATIHLHQIKVYTSAK